MAHGQQRRVLPAQVAVRKRELVQDAETRKHALHRHSVTAMALHTMKRYIRITMHICVQDADIRSIPVEI